METVEQTWSRPADEREALIAKARVWEGTQREFAAAYGVNQSTVSKWQRAVGARSYSAEERAAVVDAFASLSTLTQNRWFPHDRRSGRTAAPSWARGSP